MAARAKPAAMTKGTATDARATYLKARSLAADFAWLIRPANTFASYDFQRAPRTNPRAAAIAKVTMGWSLTDLSTAFFNLPATSPVRSDTSRTWSAAPLA